MRRNALFIAHELLSLDNIHLFQNKIQNELSGSEINIDFLFVDSSIDKTIKKPIEKNLLDLVVFTEKCSLEYINALNDLINELKINNLPLIIVIGKKLEEYKCFSSIEELGKYSLNNLGGEIF